MSDILSTAIIIQICIHELLVRILFKISRETLICAPRTRPIHEGRPVCSLHFSCEKKGRKESPRSRREFAKSSERPLPFACEVFPDQTASSREILSHIYNLVWTPSSVCRATMRVTSGNA